MDIITGVMSFGEKLVRDVMIPRDEIFAIERSATSREIAESSTSAFSRVPSTSERSITYRMVHAFDVLRWARASRHSSRRGGAGHHAVQRAALPHAATRHLAMAKDDQQRSVGLVTLETVRGAVMTCDGDEPRRGRGRATCTTPCSRTSTRACARWPARSASSRTTAWRPPARRRTRDSATRGASVSPATRCGEDRSRRASRCHARGLTVGIVCVDPTPFTGGALLNDRIRMEKSRSISVYIRSPRPAAPWRASAATLEVCDVLDAFGIDRMSSRPWAGQSELDVGRPDTTLVVLVRSHRFHPDPEGRPDKDRRRVVVNKGDRPGATGYAPRSSDARCALARRISVPAHGVDLSRNNLARHVRETAGQKEDRWTPPVLRTTATDGTGIVELSDALDRHYGYLESSGQLRARRRARLRERVVDVVDDTTRRRLWTDAATAAWLDARLPDLEAGRETPFAIADALLARSADLLTGRTT